jgi:hypothetical protein
LENLLKEPVDRPIHRARIGASVGVQVVLGVVLFLAANYLAFRHYARFDLTGTKDYTLHGATVNFLENLDQNVNLVVAFSTDAEIAPQVRVLAEEFKRVARGRVTVEFLDPGRSPDRAEELRNRFGAPLHGNTLIAEVGGRTRFLRESELASTGETGLDRRQTLTFRGEEALTAALISLSERVPRRVYLIAGKGTLAPDEHGRDASHVLLELANQQNIQLLGINLGDVERVPEDTDALVLIAPEVDLTEREAEMLRGYWEDARGSMLVMLDPTRETPRLDALLAGYGIRPRGDRVLYSENTPTGANVVFRVRNDFATGSPVSDPLAGIATEFVGQTTSLAVGEDGDALREASIENQTLIVASSRYWGETRFFQALPGFDPDEDHAPPLATAASAERGAASDARIRIDSSRLVAVGNGTLLDPGKLHEKNLDFVSNALNWLIERENLIGIPAKEKRNFRIAISESEPTRILWIIAGVLPATVFCFGLFLWSTRRA